MELSEGRVSGSRYYTAKPVLSWRHGHDWSGADTWHNMVEWCVDTYGPTPKDGIWTPNSRCNSRWYVNNAKFWFREKKDLEWFIIRWT